MNSGDIGLTIVSTFMFLFLLFSLWFYSFSKGSLFLTLLTSHISFYLFFVKNLK